MIQTCIKIFIILFLVSCGQNQNQKTKEIYNEKAVIESTGLMKIAFTKDDFIYWNPKSNKIEEDENYFSILKRKDTFKSILLNTISDTTNLGIPACFKKTNLKKGDISYILLDKFFNIPRMKVFGKQFDVLILDCSYPKYFFEYIDSNRQEIANKLATYLK